MQTGVETELLEDGINSKKGGAGEPHHHVPAAGQLLWSFLMADMSSGVGKSVRGSMHNG
jgi:hypothetical protein